jgi:RNA polymerase sigma-B factor
MHGDREKERQLFRRYRATGDPAVRDLIVGRFLGLAGSVASRYNRSTVSHDDRMQVACLGLLKAIERFDPDRGVAFSSFAVPTMVGELQRYFRDHTWMVRPPRELQERALRLESMREMLSGELGRTPTGPELARAAGVSLEDVVESLEAARARGNVSLDELVRPDGETVAATLGAVDDEYERVENAVLAEDLLAELTPRERQILRLRFEYDLTQSEIGAAVGCSQMQVSRIIRAALEQLSASASMERSELLAEV